jgi:uncharacterized protein YigA (DUF484 family)
MKDTKKNQAIVTDEVVSKYLADSPDFFDRNESALSSLIIPHVRGQAVSLVERQLLILRKQNNALREQLDEIVTNARDNEVVSEKVHAITLILLKEKELEKKIQAVEHHFRQELDASNVCIALFSEARKMAGFSSRESSMYLSLEEFILKGEIKCGPISQSHFLSIFSDYDPNNSAVMLPMKESEWSGAFIICSSNPKKYFSGMRTDFLLRFVDIFKEMVNKHVSCN